MAWIVAVLAFAALLALAMYNPAWVVVKFFVWQASLPLVGLVLIAAGLGALLVGAWALVRGFHQFRRHRGSLDRIRELELELTRSQEQNRVLAQELQRLHSQVQPGGAE